MNGIPIKYNSGLMKVEKSNKLRLNSLTILKLIHAKWLADFYNHITTPEGKQVISSGWSTAGIINALKNEETCLEPLDAFADIDPLVSKPCVEQDDSNIL